MLVIKPSKIQPKSVQYMSNEPAQSEPQASQAKPRYQDQAAMFNALTLRSCRSVDTSTAISVRTTTSTSSASCSVHLLCSGVLCVHITNERTQQSQSKNPHTRTFASQARYTPIVKRSVSVSASASASASVPVPAASGERDTQIHRYSARTQRYGSSLPAFASYSSYMAYGPYGSGLWHSLYAVYFILQRQKLYYVRSSDWLGHSVQRKFYTVNRAATEPKSSRFYRFAAIKTQITRLFRTGECQVLHYDWFVIV